MTDEVAKAALQLKTVENAVFCGPPLFNVKLQWVVPQSLRAILFN